MADLVSADREDGALTVFGFEAGRTATPTLSPDLLTGLAVGVRGPEIPEASQLIGGNTRLVGSLEASSEHPLAEALVHRAEGDGEYWFAVRTVDKSGRAWPEGPYQPELRVIVVLRVIGPNICEATLDRLVKPVPIVQMPAASR